MRWTSLVNIWSIDRYKKRFLTKSHRPEVPLACPARFERATYALEALKMSLNNKLHNGISLARSGVQLAPRTVVSSGIAWHPQVVGSFKVEFVG